MAELDKTNGQWTKGKRKGATLDSYPTLFMELLKRASQEKFGLECGSNEGAKRYMGKLNAFKGAVYRIARTDENVKVWEVMVRQVYMTVEGSTLWIMPRAMEPDNLIAEKALGVISRPAPLPVDPVALGAAESLKLVMGMLDGAGAEHPPLSEFERINAEAKVTAKRMWGGK